MDNNVNTNVQTKEVTGKLIFNQTIAKRLLNMDNDLIAIEPNRHNRNQTVFIFRLDDKLREDMGKATEKPDGEVDKKYKLVSSPRIAGRLLREGYKVVDINPDRDNSDRTVFIFESSDDLLDEIAKLEKRRDGNPGEKTVAVKVKTA